MDLRSGLWVMGHTCPKQICSNGRADPPESREAEIANDQIPMTSEKDNDQFTNNQLNNQTERTGSIIC